MLDIPVSRRAAQIIGAGSNQLLMDYVFTTYMPHRPDGDRIADFTFGNPHEMPLTGVVDTLQQWIVPQNKGWFAYKFSEPAAQQVVADSLRTYLVLPFEPEDIALTPGGSAALVCAVKAVTDPGDEVIFSLPPWFGYEPMCIEAGLVPVKVRINTETFDLDLDAIAAAITARTRVLIVNTPQNPTGKVISPETLTRLATLLDESSERIGRRIYLLCDEPYNRLVFDALAYHSPVEFYPYSFLAYSYGKTLLIPGQRIGYLAMPPTMPRADRERLRAALFNVQVYSGFLFPNALLQHALGDLEQLTLDVAHLQRKRDHMVDALQEMGYEVHRPEGTFYLFPKSPIPDDQAFTELLMEEEVFVIPGRIFETPGFFRICLTANDAMIERGLPGFRRAIERVSSGKLAVAALD